MTFHSLLRNRLLAILFFCAFLPSTIFGGYILYRSFDSLQVHHAADIKQKTTHLMEHIRDYTANGKYSFLLLGKTIDAAAVQKPHSSLLPDLQQTNTSAVFFETLYLINKHGNIHEMSAAPMAKEAEKTLPTMNMSQEPAFREAMETPGLHEGSTYLSLYSGEPIRVLSIRTGNMVLVGHMRLEPLLHLIEDAEYPLNTQITLRDTAGFSITHLHTGGEDNNTEPSPARLTTQLSSPFQFTSEVRDDANNVILTIESYTMTQVPGIFPALVYIGIMAATLLTGLFTITRRATREVQAVLTPVTDALEAVMRNEPANHIPPKGVTEMDELYAAVNRLIDLHRAGNHTGFTPEEYRNILRAVAMQKMETHMGSGYIQLLKYLHGLPATAECNLQETTNDLLQIIATGSCVATPGSHFTTVLGAPVLYAEAIAHLLIFGQIRMPEESRPECSISSKGETLHLTLHFPQMRMTTEELKGVTGAVAPELMRGCTMGNLRYARLLWEEELHGTLTVRILEGESVTVYCSTELLSR